MEVKKIEVNKEHGKKEGDRDPRNRLIERQADRQTGR